MIFATYKVEKQQANLPVLVPQAILFCQYTYIELTWECELWVSTYHATEKLRHEKNSLKFN